MFGVDFHTYYLCLSALLLSAPYKHIISVIKVNMIAFMFSVLYTHTCDLHINANNKHLI